MTFTSLGIDPSTSATGVVLLEETKGKQPKVLIESEISYPKFKGMERNRAIVTDLMEIVTERRPDRIVVEGYSLNLKNASSVVPLVELGGLLRFMLHLDCYKWLDPRASEVKKFATGKGNSPKEVVMMNVLKRWGYESATNNIADAYVCACMGLAHANRLPEINLEMRKIAGALAINSH